VGSAESQRAGGSYSEYTRQLVSSSPSTLQKLSAKGGSRTGGRRTPLLRGAGRAGKIGGLPRSSEGRQSSLQPLLSPSCMLPSLLRSTRPSRLPSIPARPARIFRLMSSSLEFTPERAEELRANYEGVGREVKEASPNVSSRTAATLRVGLRTERCALPSVASRASSSPCQRCGF
jgi:hypothetical protein